MVLSYNDLNGIATDITNKYYSKHNKPFERINITILLKELFNINVEYYTLSKDGSILGIASFDEAYLKVLKQGKPTIIEVDKNVVLIEERLLDNSNIGRLNFTIAHEGAHQIIYDLSYGGYSKHIYYRNLEHTSHRPTDWTEWQANTLASCLLMPEKKVRDMYSLFYSNEYISNLNPLNMQLYSPFVVIAEFFGVSLQALAIRMQHLGLLHSYNLQSNIDIYKEVV